MKTLIEIPTLGDEMTLPGGIALRARADGELIVHNYNTDRETGTRRDYWQGSYFTAGSLSNRFMNALTELTRRAERASAYSTGGALDMGKLLGLPEIPGFVDASGTLDMMDALNT